MSTTDNLTDNAQPDATHVDAADAEEAVDSPDTFSLADLNQKLGKNFPDVATALKSLQDTQSYVGKKIEQANEPQAAQPAPHSDLATKEEVQSLKNQLFYSTNPQYKGYEDVIIAMGSNPAEVVGTDAFKKIFEKAQVAEEVEKQKSVVSSNSRLGQSKTLIDEAVSVSNARGATNEDVATVLARGINESLNN